jgi:hypothetical protein
MKKLRIEQPKLVVLSGDTIAMPRWKHRENLNRGQRFPQRDP